jgi:hypothetical protein
MLALFGRENIDFGVVDTPVCFVESLRSTFISISTGFLAKVDSDEELEAWVGHELAHEINLEQMMHARANDDLAGQRAVELFCDAVSTCALNAIGKNPSHFTDALRRVLESSPEIFAANDGSGDHPSLRIRVAVNQAIAASLSQQPVPFSRPQSPNLAAALAQK